MTKRKSVFAVLMCVVLSIVMLFTMASCKENSTQNEEQQQQQQQQQQEKTDAESRLEQAPVEGFKQLSVGDTVYVVPTDDKISVVKSGKKLQPEELIFVTSLQGVVAQTKAQIYIGQMDDDWVTYLTENYGLKFEKITSLEDLLDKFADATNKTYVKFRYYDSNVSISNINAATTIAGATKSVMFPVNEDNDYAALQSLLDSKGFTALDVGVDLMEDTLGDDKAIEQYQDKLSKDTVALLNPMQKSSYQLRDYAIASSAGVVMADYSVKNIVTNAYMATNPLAIAIGNSAYTHPSYGAKGMTMEQWIEEASLTATAPVLASEMPNLSLFAALPKTDIGTQVATKDNATDGDVHYVAVVLNAGNDVQFWENANSTKTKLASGDKGKYPVGYTMNTSLYELMPNAIKSTYASMTDNEVFIAAPSGFGMTDLDILKDLNGGTLLDKYLERSNAMFGGAGLNYISTYGSVADTATLDKWAGLSNVKGGFVLTANYETPTGGVYISNGKVFLAAREVMRGELYRTNEQIANDSIAKLVARLERYATEYTDKTSAEAYTLIQIEDTATISTYDKLVKQLYEAVGDKICFVTPDQMLSLIQANVVADKTTQTIGTLNVAPTAQAIEMSTTEGKQAKVDVADYIDDANPEDVESLVTAIANRPAHGTARISAGKIVYKPETGYTGTDTFEYTVNDGTEVVTGVVTVTIE